MSADLVTDYVLLRVRRDPTEYDHPSTWQWNHGIEPMAEGSIVVVDPDDDGCEIDGRSGFCHRDHECPEPDLDGEDLFPARPVSHRDAITDGCLEATRD